MRGPIVQRSRVEIRSIRPNERMNLRIDSHSIENGKIAQRAIHRTCQDRPKIDHLLGAVVKLHAQRVGGFDLKGLDSINWVQHCFIDLSEWIDWQRWLACLKSLPVGQELILV